MPPTAAQRSAAAQFQDFTGAGDKATVSYMRKYAYNVEQATDAYFAAVPSAVSGAHAKALYNLDKLFESFRDKQDDKDVMGIDGTMNYFTEIGVNFDDASLFVALEIVRAATMGELEKTAFVEGWKSASMTPDRLTYSKPLDTIAIQNSFLAQQKEALATDLALYKRVYRNIFLSVKDKGQKAIPLENAIMYWQVIFSERPWKSGTTDWLALWKEYLEARWTKSVNKDMWNQVFEFYLKSMDDETLGFWSEDSAWPGVIDEFVAYAKSKRSSDTMETD